MANGVNENYPFYFGNASREDAESLLRPQLRGLFLIRPNHHYKGDYTLSVVHGNPEAFSIEHYRIKVIADRNMKLTIDDEGFFDSFEDLVKHYEADADGLVTKLKFYPGQLPQQSLLEKEKFTVGELIGKGNFSEVYEGKFNGDSVAIKILKDETAAKEYLLEAKVMITLDHKNLVKLIGLNVDEALMILTEFMSKGSLLDYLRSRGRIAITPMELIKFARDTCKGMAYLESKNVVHRDLAARNILIHEDGTAKVADFGLARTNNVPTEQPEGKIAVRWTAPEAYLHKQFSSKSDVWSFGVVLWEIYSFGRVPYPRITIGDVMKHIEEGHRMDAPEGCPPAINQTMQRVWKFSPKERPSFKDILNTFSQIENLKD